MAASRGVEFGHDQAGDLVAAGLDGDGKGSADATNAAVEREFADEKAVGNFFLVQATVGAENAQGHGQIEAGAFLADVGGGEIDGDVGGRNVVAAVL